MDWMDEANAYRDLIMTNIEYDILYERYGEERMDEVVELMLEAVISKRPYSIGKATAADTCTLLSRHESVADCQE